MRKLTFLIAAMLVVIGSGIVFTDDGGSRNFRLRLTGLEEAPLVISTVGRGTFQARINKDETEITWRLTYDDLEGTVQQAHIHFGAQNVVGGISVFLCSNLGNGPAGTQPCPLPPLDGVVEGVSDAADVIGPTGQGIEPGALAELITAIRAGKAYANVHSTKWPGGEIRQQFPADRDDDHDHH
jgi:CHRD domain